MPRCGGAPAILALCPPRLSRSGQRRFASVRSSWRVTHWGVHCARLFPARLMCCSTRPCGSASCVHRVCPGRVAGECLDEKLVALVDCDTAELRLGVPSHEHREFLSGDELD